MELDAPGPVGLIGIEADRLGFELVTQAVEILGRCSLCREEGGGSHTGRPSAREPGCAVGAEPA